MSNPIPRIVNLHTDLLVIGGGAAGCAAAVRAKEADPNINVLIVEKAHIERSGCLAAGINALNAYLHPGETPESFLEYVRRDNYGLVREDLVLSIARGVNGAAARLEKWGLPIYKGALGNYLARGKRSVAIAGERIKPLMAEAVSRSGCTVLNRLVATNYILDKGHVQGAYGFDVRSGDFYVIAARAVICATGGAAGVYRSPNPPSSRNKGWYPPYNTGAGYALGIRAGAEMTTLEMRFIALRVKGTMAPTGTLAQGVKAKQINARGENYLLSYNLPTTAGRLWATLEENRRGYGPCYLDTTALSPEQGRQLKEAYLNMCPAMALWWADRGEEPHQQPLEITGSEPYIVGGHGAAGYWVDVQRRTTLPGLWAAGDVAGGAPKKYVTGAMAEGEIAVEDALNYIKRDVPAPGYIKSELTAAEIERVYAPLSRNGGVAVRELEEAMQQVMDEYAGGVGSGYATNEERLRVARERIALLRRQDAYLYAGDLHQLLEAHQVIDRLDVAAAVIEHLLYRRETRWPCYQTRLDYPEKDDENWLKFINSVYAKEQDSFRIIERKPGEGQ
ncbi:MAG: adenylyl-sulfate reductase subunit alpha [Bacillota bacterium]